MLYRWYPAKRALPPCLRMADRALLAGYPRYLLWRLTGKTATFTYNKLIISPVAVSHSVCQTKPRDCLYIKMPPYQYRNSHYIDEMVLWLAYLYNGNPHTFILVWGPASGMWLFVSSSGKEVCLKHIRLSRKQWIIYQTRHQGAAESLDKWGEECVCVGRLEIDWNSVASLIHWGRVTHICVS